MHRSVMEFGREVLLQEDCQGKRVLEVGSRNINGTLRDHVLSLKPLEYIGVDYLPGKGVDKVLDALNLSDDFGPESFDLVLSTEMLEHCMDWKGAVRSMFSVCRKNGIILLTARGPGFHYHGYPHDYWRFTTEDVARIFGGNDIMHNRVDWFSPGFLAKIRKTGDSIDTDFEVLPMTKKAVT